MGDQTLMGLAPSRPAAGGAVRTWAKRNEADTTAAYRQAAAIARYVPTRGRAVRGGGGRKARAPRAEFAPAFEGVRDVRRSPCREGRRSFLCGHRPRSGYASSTDEVSSLRSKRRP